MKQEHNSTVSIEDLPVTEDTFDENSESEEEQLRKANKEALQQALLEEIERKRKAEVSMLEQTADIESERLRMLADMENFKKRLLREQEEQKEFLAAGILTSLLPVLDNLSLALQYGGNIPEAKDFYTGVEMTYKLLLENLASFGLVQVGMKGEAFSVAIHEAVSMEHHDDIEPNIVVTVIQPGYTLNGRTLRPAKVVVSQ